MDASKYRAVLQPMLDEPVLAGGLFYRTGGWSGLTLGPISGLAALVSRGIGRRRAAGLPSQFLVAVTPTRVHAFGCSMTSGRVKAKEELVVWERSGLTVTAEETAANTKVVIDSLEASSRVVCSTGKDEESQSVVYAMQEPVGTPAAA
jgi:hypothetical protein